MTTSVGLCYVCGLGDDPEADEGEGTVEDCYICQRPTCEREDCGWSFSSVRSCEPYRTDLIMRACESCTIEWPRFATMLHVLAASAGINIDWNFVRESAA